ncbi:MAG: hypothetical protein PHX82_06815 [Paracoccaceae bacterium]|jgi:hypothetical protein|nr:hypothetical protein [Paracoccaceae bacterium]
MLNLAIPQKPKAVRQDHPVLGSRQSLYQALSQRAERVLSRNLLPKGSIVMCGETGAVEVYGLAAREGASLFVVPEEHLSTQWLADHIADIDVLIVDGDYLGDVEDTVDFCLRVRRAAPGLPIILVSSEMRGDDFTCERMQACDVSLKSAFTENRLRAAIKAAYENNEYFLSTRM